MPRRDGILSEPIDLDGPRRPRVTYPAVEATPGLAITPRGERAPWTVVSARADQLYARDPAGRQHLLRPVPGAFTVGGRAVTLVAPRPRPAPAAAARTASGSVAAPAAPARVARASRILVEGLHDAELVEKVWGDDLRGEGVVVEVLHGADDLAAVARAFGPRPGRRLGILLDHLVDGSKETRLAAAVGHPDVLVTGHPFVDVWQAVRPAALGIAAWPAVPPGTPWKEGVIAALGSREEPRAFWRRVLAAVGDWTDLEPALIGAVEQLIDFVTEPAPA
ncbi:MAG TPA: DUF3097 family protein [Acidimicrobiales bacterium]|nr:DUF3097 family protein [Acidimicrobiales bacterium]